MRAKPGFVARPQRGVGTRRIVGVLTIAFGVLCYPLGFVVLKVGGDAGSVLRVLTLVCGPLLIGVAWPIIRLGRRLVATFGDWAELEEDPRPPIVYLRPFAEDRVQYVTPWRSRVVARPWRRLL